MKLFNIFSLVRVVTFDGRAAQAASTWGSELGFGDDGGAAQVRWLSDEVAGGRTGDAELGSKDGDGD